MAAPPIGTITFLFTDIEGSTRRWEAGPERMRVELRRHDELLRGIIEDHRGHVFKTTGDGTLAAFADASDAVDAALTAQQRVAETLPFAVRVAVHTGAAELRDGDYFGPTLNRAARLLSIGHGGQVLVSAATAALVLERLPVDTSLLDLGEHGLRDLTRPERVWQLCHPDLRADFAPLRSLDAARTNLPVQLTSFVGRARDLVRLDAQLRAHRLVTLTGAGGVGKTRLALQSAALQGALHAFAHHSRPTQQRFVDEWLCARRRRVLVRLGDLGPCATGLESVAPCRVTLGDELEDLAGNAGRHLRSRRPLLQRDPEHGDAVVAFKLGADRGTRGTTDLRAKVPLGHGGVRVRVEAS